MRISILILFIFFNLFQKDILGLKSDLKKDKVLLSLEYGGTNIKLKDLDTFNSYANIDLSKFSSNKKVVNNNVITRWKDSKTQLTILKVETVLAGDTVFKAGEVKQKSLGHRETFTGDIKLNPHNYIYNTYIIIPNKWNKLIYLTEKGEGLIEFKIGTKKHQPIHEPFTLGQNYPNLDQIVKLALSLK